MKYETGVKDKYGNVAYDFVKVCKDMKRVVEGKIKFTKSLYHVFMQRFTIAHYDIHGWLYTYNGNWGALGQQLKHTWRYVGDLQYTPEDNKAIDDLALFLIENDKKKIPELL